MGYLHHASIDDWEVDDLAEVKVGDEVKVRIVGADLASGRMYLTTSPINHMDLEPFRSLPPNKLIKGEVLGAVAKEGYINITLPGGGTSTIGFVRRTEIWDSFVQ